MPEIVEVERLCGDIRELWIGRKILSIIPCTEKFPVQQFMGYGTQEDFLKKVINFTVLGAERVGKNVVLMMSSGEMWQIHLSQTGWLVQTKSLGVDQLFKGGFIHSISPNTFRLKIGLGDGQEWAFADARVWGKFYLRKGKRPMDDPYLASLGVDWLKSPEAASLSLLTYRGNKLVKLAVMDQKLASGLGNYLACEALYLAKIHPHARWQSLSPQKVGKLIESIRLVVYESLKDPDPAHWRVFQREGSLCSQGHKIIYIKDPGAQRGSYLCGECQQLEVPYKGRSIARVDLSNFQG